MTLFSIHHTCRRHRPPEQLTSARLDGADEVSSSTMENTGEKSQRPLAMAKSKSHSAIQDFMTRQERVRCMDELVLPTTTQSASITTTKKSTTKRTGSSEAAFAKTRRQTIEANKKHVSFSAVHIREHALTVGDHEWCDGSLPIQLDWQHAATRSIPLDDFEWQRQRQGRVPRGRLPKVDFVQRKRLLRRVSGITDEDLLLLERQHIDSKYVTLHCSKTVTFYQR